jgi:succinoglycan biosynthesis protein ExoA
MNRLVHLPPVSVILPVRNEALFIERALMAIFAQDYEGPAEILIADGMSTDGTRDIVNRLAKQQSAYEVRILDNPQRIVPTGMNIAIMQAKGDVLIRVDGHCLIPPDYVRKCVDYLGNGGLVGVGGPMLSIGETPTAQVIASAMSSQFGVGNSAFRTIAGVSRYVDTVPFAAYGRQTIEEVGLYDEELVRNQDDEYNFRVRALGGRILLAGDLHTKYFSRSSLRSLWGQYFQYGFWKVRVLQKHPRQMRWRQFAPPLLVAALAISLIALMRALWVGELAGALYFCGVALAYILANLAASVWLAIRKRVEHLPLLPVAFAVLHIGYGLGFLFGVVRFWSRWGDRVGRTPGWARTHPGGPVG